MNCLLSRESVAAGDDVYAPHQLAVSFPHVRSVEDLVKAIVGADYIPRMGKIVSWCISSGEPLALVSSTWPEPQPISMWPPLEALDIRDGIVYCHISYMSARDPEVVLSVLRELRVRGS